MIRLLVALLLLSVSLSVHATKPQPPQQDQLQKQDQDQTQEQVQTQQQVQRQDQTQSMGDQQNTQTMSFYSEENVSSAIAPNVFSTSPCYVGGTAALGVKGLNIGGGKMKLDEECEARETARLFMAAGERETAIRLLCTTNAAARLDECKPTVTEKELRERIQFLLDERERDRERCEESKDRITETFNKECRSK